MIDINSEDISSWFKFKDNLFYNRHDHVYFSREIFFSIFFSSLVKITLKGDWFGSGVRKGNFF